LPNEDVKNRVAGLGKCDNSVTYSLMKEVLFVVGGSERRGRRCQRLGVLHRPKSVGAVVEGGDVVSGGLVQFECVNALHSHGFFASPSFNASELPLFRVERERANLVLELGSDCGNRNSVPRRGAE